jgi:hypothetical protein
VSPTAVEVPPTTPTAEPTSPAVKTCTATLIGVGGACLLQFDIPPPLPLPRLTHTQTRTRTTRTLPSSHTSTHSVSLFTSHRRTAECWRCWWGRSADSGRLYCSSDGRVLYIGTGSGVESRPFLERSQTKSKQAILGTFPDKEQAGHSWNVPRQRASRPFLERSQTKSKQARMRAHVRRNLLLFFTAQCAYTSRKIFAAAGRACGRGSDRGGVDRSGRLRI